MDIFGILDPDPHENLCGSETLALTGFGSVTLDTMTTFTIVYINPRCGV